MSNNVKNGPNAVVATTTISFTAAGLTSENLEIVFLVGASLKSYKPERAINGISGFQAGKGYYLVAKQDIDINTIVLPTIQNVFSAEFGSEFE